MTLEWYEWGCPYCRRIGEVDPTKDYENGQTMRMSCPHCNGEVVVLCDYQPTFAAYRPKHFNEDHAAPCEHNAELQDAIYARDDAYRASIVSAAIALGVEVDW